MPGGGRGWRDAEGLSVRDRRLIAGVLEGQDITVAGKAAGFPQREGATNRLRHPDVRRALLAALEAEGLDAAGLAAKARELLESIQHGLTKDGSVVAMGPDNHARVKALDLILKASGAYPDPRLEINQQVSGAIVVLQPEDVLAAGDLFGPEVIDVTPSPEIPPPNPENTPL